MCALQGLTQRRAALPPPPSTCAASRAPSTQQGRRRSASFPPSPATTSGRGAAAGQQQQWAVRGGVPNLAAEWERLRPNLAHTFPFELDTFQKEAILHIEQVPTLTLCSSVQV